LGGNQWSISLASLEEILSVIANMKIPEPLPKEETLIVQVQNDRHITDLQLRKCLKELIEANPELK